MSGPADHAGADRDGQAAAPDVARWVLLYVADLSGEPVERIDPAGTLARYDIDSVDAVEMAMAFERRRGLDVDPELFMRTDLSIAQLVDLLSARLAEHPVRAIPDR